MKKSIQYGFTIVELLIVIVVIGILATIIVVSYNGVTDRAAETSLKSDVEGAASNIGSALYKDGVYPAVLPSSVKTNNATVLEYSSNGKHFCLIGSVPNPRVSKYSIVDNGTLTKGVCTLQPSQDPNAIADGSHMQTITTSNCPSTRTRAVDARDGNTYWVQKLGDGRCWMLTNLAYAGDGLNTYGDTKQLSSISSTGPAYFVPDPGANVTYGTTNPSTSTSGTGQYGYLYNWCGAMGGQETAACMGTSTPAPNPAITVCPKGWRLPTGNGGEFAALNNVVNSASLETDSGLRMNWFAQRAGYWQNQSTGFVTQGTEGHYWSSTQRSDTTAYDLYFRSNSVYPAGFANKEYGGAVRCIAN